MARITYPLNDIDYSAEDAELFHCTRTSGIYAMNHFPISIGGTNNRTVTIGKGIAWIQNKDDASSDIAFTGKVFANTANMSFQEGNVGDATYPRIDRYMIRFDKAANSTGFARLRGTPSSTPVAPAISRTVDVYDLVLYDILVPANASSYSTSNITDQRANTQLCGLMRDGIQSLNPAPTSRTLTINTSSWTGSSAPYTCSIGSLGQVVITPTNHVIVTPRATQTDTVSMPTCMECGVFCSGQDTQRLYFTAQYDKPSVAVTFNILVLDTIG